MEGENGELASKWWAGSAIPEMRLHQGSLAGYVSIILGISQQVNISPCQDVLFGFNDATFLLLIVVHLGAVGEFPRLCAISEFVRRRVGQFPVRPLRSLRQPLVHPALTSANVII